jgi:mono/diheme cytochrome c family protein/cytochrome c553
MVRQGAQSMIAGRAMITDACHRFPIAVPIAGPIALAQVLLCLGVVLSGLTASDTSDAMKDFNQVVTPFLETHCTTCHGEKKQKGDLRVDTLARDFTNAVVAGHWMEIMDRINSGDMPPKKQPRPKPKDIARVADLITAQLSEADAARQASEGETVSFHRLSREEYRNTIHDLLGITYDASDPAGLPEDPDWQGFERIGSVLTVSPAHIEKYLSAAEAILSEGIALGPQPKAEVIHWDPFMLRWGYRWPTMQKEYQARGNADQVRDDIVPNNGINGTPGDNQQLTITTAGDYVVRVKLSGLRPAGGIPPRLTVNAIDLGRVLYEHDIEAPEDRPVTIEFRAHLPVGVHPIRILNAVPGPNPEDHSARPSAGHAFISLQSRPPWQVKLTDEAFRPLVPILLVDWVEWEGPMIPSWPPPTHRRIFPASAATGDDLARAREILTRFVATAYRRPAQGDEVDRLLALVQHQLQLKEGFTSAVKTGVLAALCSKSFLYIVEGTAGVPSRRLTAWELASRLSYFLWGSLPDDRLLELARQGTLGQPDILRAEVRRLLADAKALRFADAFPRQWLQLRRVGMFAPDRKLYPDYDDYLEKSMVAETTAFFREVLTHHLGLREFLDSDWTMLNERLARHYGIAGVTGEDMQRVALTPDEHRGGLLTQASILSLTSDGTRHRPVHRGKWILESIIGKAPPPPPANVPAIKVSAPNQPKASLRAKLEAHREDPTCASCHRKIDPLGLAFDNYDAVGHWRTEEVVRDGAGDNPQIDASGELPDGRTFSDAVGLKKLLADDLDKFAAAFCDKLATYALRRGMTFGDRKALAMIAAQSKSEGYRLDDLIEHLVLSDLFQSR